MIFFDMDSHSCTVEVHTGNHVQREQINAPKMMLQAKFVQLMDMAGRSPSPMKVKIIKEEKVWDPLIQTHKPLENFMEFRNNTWERAYKQEENFEE